MQSGSFLFWRGLPRVVLSFLFIKGGFEMSEETKEVEITEEMESELNSMGKGE